LFRPQVICSSGTSASVVNVSGTLAAFVNAGRSPRVRSTLLSTVTLFATIVVLPVQSTAPTEM
jgi:hypothetical protein